MNADISRRGFLMNGNPIANVSLIEDPERNFSVIMKDGTIYKNTAGSIARDLLERGRFRAARFPREQGLPNRPKIENFGAP
jgi:hypothetical protein